MGAEAEIVDKKWRYTWEAQSHTPILRLFLFPFSKTLNLSLQHHNFTVHLHSPPTFLTLTSSSDSLSLRVPVPNVLLDAELPPTVRSFTDHIEVKLLLLLPVDHPALSALHQTSPLPQPLLIEYDVDKLSSAGEVEFVCRSCRYHLTNKPIRNFVEMPSANWREVADNWFGACCCSFGGISEKLVTRYVNSHTCAQEMCLLSSTSVTFCKDDLVESDFPERCGQLHGCGYVADDFGIDVVSEGIGNFGFNVERTSTCSDACEVNCAFDENARVGHPGNGKVSLNFNEVAKNEPAKRLSKSGASPRISEVGKIQTLYNSVVADDARRSGPSNVESKRSSNEISLVLEESKSLPLNKESQSHQTSKSTLSRNAPSSKIAVATPQNDNGASFMQSDLECSSSKVEGSLQSSEPYQIENQTSASSSISCCNTNGSKVELCEKDSSPKKLGNKASMSKNVRKGMLQTTSSSSTSVNGSRVCKLSRSPRTVKLAIKNKDSGKKKLKQGSDSALSAPPCNETNNKSVPASTAPLVCERCWCEIENTNIENSKGIVTPGSLSPADGINLKSMLSGPASAGCNSSREVAKVKKNSRLKEQLEFSQSSKSSQGDYSSSTSTSDESNVSGSSCGNRPHMSKDYRWQAIRDAQVQHRVLGLRHFNLLKKLGCGDIGTVYLSELIGQNCLFAIKVMDNEFLARRKKMPRAQTEREILRMLDHPFLPTLYAQFTSENLSCLVMEYCPGGDLHVLRQKQLGRCFSEPAARFYVAEVLLALEYLHMLGVVYRDLKPENILVREDGHIMLTDFDLSLRCDVSPTLLKSSSDKDPAKVSGPYAKSSCIEPFCIEPSCQVPCFSPRFLPPAAKARKLKADLAAHIKSLPQLVAEPTDARSNSFVGTHEYLAPEIIKGEGHGAAVDWWTFGVFLYELLYGRTPFKGSNNEETLANVVLQNLRFPDTPFVSFQARDLIKGLLVKEPENRLGTEKGAAEIKQHPFFEGLNWALIRCAIPPELPDLCEFELGVSDMIAESQSKGGKYLECATTGEQVEFELF